MNHKVGYKEVVNHGNKHRAREWQTQRYNNYWDSHTIIHFFSPLQSFPLTAKQQKLEPFFFFITSLSLYSLLASFFLAFSLPNSFLKARVLYVYSHAYIYIYIYMYICVRDKKQKSINHGCIYLIPHIDHSGNSDHYYN